MTLEIDVSTLEAEMKYRNIDCFFIILHIVFGLDFGYFKRRSPRSKLTVKFITLSYCFSVSLAVSIYLLLNYDTRFFVKLYVFYVLIQNIYNVVVLTFSVDHSFYNFQKTLLLIDSKLLTVDSFNIENKVIISCCLYYIVSVIWSLLYCLRYPEECVQPFVNIGVFLRLLSFNTVLIVCFFVFYSVYLRMKVFLDFVKNSGGATILECLNIYKSILDAVEEIKKTFDILVTKHLYN